MIDVKAAIRIALHFVGEVLQGDKLRGTRLEEVAISEDGAVWHVTLSFLRGDSPSDLASAIEQGTSREYKVVEVSAKDGTVRSMKIRQLESA